MRCKFGDDIEFSGEIRKNAPTEVVKKMQDKN